MTIYHNKVCYCLITVLCTFLLCFEFIFINWNFQDFIFCLFIQRIQWWYKVSLLFRININDLPSRQSMIQVKNYILKVNTDIFDSIITKLPSRPLMLGFQNQITDIKFKKVHHWPWMIYFFFCIRGYILFINNTIITTK